MPLSFWLYTTLVPPPLCVIDGPMGVYYIPASSAVSLAFVLLHNWQSQMSSNIVTREIYISPFSFGCILQQINIILPSSWGVSTSFWHCPKSSPIDFINQRVWLPPNSVQSVRDSKAKRCPLHILYICIILYYPSLYISPYTTTTT